MKRHVQFLCNPSLWCLVLAWGHVASSAADGGQTSDLQKNHAEYVTETSIPKVPAAALLGDITEAQIVEVSSVSKVAASLAALRSAGSNGTPFGIDVSPAMLLAERGGAFAKKIKADGYASDYLAGLIFRTRISVATTQKDNSQMSAWGITTRLIDLRDPFVDPGVERCFTSYSSSIKSGVLSAPPRPAGVFKPQHAQSLKNALTIIEPKADTQHIDAAIGQDISSPTAAMQQVRADYERLEKNAAKSAQEIQAQRKALDDEYRDCIVKARNELPKRSYLAVGYTQGSSRAVDATRPVDTQPGKALWLTFVYGFEGLGNVFGGEKKWRDSGPRSAQTTWLEATSRITLHAARKRGGSTRAEGVESNFAADVLALGFDYADVDTRRWSAQLAAQRNATGAQRRIERTAVLGLDIKVREDTWLGLSWRRRSVATGSMASEVKAQLKWAFSEGSWLQR
jgi:hypothetical protein